ncbi:phage tail tube protein [Salsuginibacillus kocurii]|uniref:phage tail tube protein n=1 Tax=Salsuginibacillus kocurii TaxID=427078 RepID=UPI00037C0326|nr:phage tail tube protein [Salsuginibacillus kocurii]
MPKEIEGRRVINGKWGKLYLDGEYIAEVQAFSATVTPNREEISMVQSMGQDSKLLNYEGEGEITLHKVFSRGKEALIEAWSEGRDPRSKIVAALDDPDAEGGQAERVAIDGVWFNEQQVLNFESGEAGTREISFGFNPDNIDFLDTIDA